MTTFDDCETLFAMKDNRIGVRLDKELLRKLDKVAATMERTRSDTIRILLTQSMLRRKVA